MTPRVAIRLIVERPLPGVELRVQRGRDGLLAPSDVSTDAVAFEFPLGAELRDDGGVRLRGSEVQGPSGARFVYVTVGVRAGQIGSPWDRRAKVPLSGLDAATVTAALAHPGARLVASVEGRARDGGPACAGVPLLGTGWRVVLPDA